MKGKVWFIGAGPGDPELITVKGSRIIQQADTVVYAGSLVPAEIVSTAKKDADIHDSSSMTLEETHAVMAKAAARGETVARVHTGDPSLYGAVPEQARLLDRDGVEYEIVPGVTSAMATAAVGKVSFTLPEVRQTLIITRMDGRTPVPASESIESLARHRAAMAVYLSATKPAELRAQLLAGGLSGTTQVVIGYRIGWPQQGLVHCTVDELPSVVEKCGFTRQTMFLVLPEGDASRSKLYDGTFSHGFRENV